MAPLSPSSPRIDSRAALVPGDDLLSSLAIQHKRNANGDPATAAAGAGESSMLTAAVTTFPNDADSSTSSAAASSSSASAYAAGERAALARAFREALPSQQALGALANAVTSLQSRVGSSEAVSREAAAAAAAAAALARSVDERLTILETGRIPALEAAGGAREAAEGLRGVLEALSSSLTKVAESAVESANNRNSTSFGGIAASLALSAINATEAAAARLLLGSGGAASAAASSSTPSSSSATAVALGAALTVASLEALMLSSDFVSRNLLPRPLSRAVRPARGALRAARAAAWGAGAVLAGCALRRACFVLAERATRRPEQQREEEREEEEGGEAAAAAVEDLGPVVAPEPSLAV